MVKQRQDIGHVDLATFRRKAVRNSLEVEDIIAAALSRTPGLAAELETLIVKCAWGDGRREPNGNLVIPFRRWANVAIAYSNSGYDSLVDKGGDPAFLPFVLSFLAEAHSNESIEATALLLRTYAARDSDIARKFATTINQLLSLKPCLVVSAEAAVAFREFLHGFVASAQSTADRAVAILALRGVGDEESVRLVKSFPPMTDAWQGTEKLVISAIRKRLRKGNA